MNVLLRRIAIVAVVALTAAIGAIEPVKSFTFESGQVKIRFDGAKFNYPNRIEFRDRILCIDHVGAHYGLVIAFPDVKGFVGSGHMETGHKERLLALEVTVDGKTILPQNGDSFTGKNLQLRKKSDVRGFEINYLLTLENNVIDEYCSVFSPEKRRTKSIYALMHPWSSAFTDFYATNEKGEEYRVEFKGDDKFPMRDRVPFATWYDRNSGFGVVSVALPSSGDQNWKRWLWDRKVYRKDYFVDFTNVDFPAGHRAEYHSRTGFFHTMAADWRTQAAGLSARLLKTEEL